jgi:type 1 fimbria pilin
MRIWIWTVGQIPLGVGGGYYGTPTAATVIPLQLPQQDLSANGAAYGTGYVRIRVELIKTAPDWQSGVLQVTGPILSVTDHTGRSGSRILTNLSLSGTLNVHSCNVTTTKLIVDLGSVRMPDIAFDKPAASKPFTIEMTCSSNPKVSVQFDGLAVVGNQKVLQLRNDPGAATGIGLQISDSTGHPVTIGQGTPLIDAAPNGINRFNFSARYVPIATHRTPGTADANATFTMEYN